MNDEELDRLVAQSMYSNTDVRSLDLRVGEADLMENVMNSTTPTIERPQPVRPKPTRRRRNLFAGLSSASLSPPGAGPRTQSSLTGSTRTRPNSSMSWSTSELRHQFRERPPRRKHHQQRTHRRVLDGGRHRFPRGPPVRERRRLRRGRMRPDESSGRPPAAPVGQLHPQRRPTRRNRTRPLHVPRTSTRRHCRRRHRDHRTGPSASRSPHPTATSWSSPTYQSNPRRRRVLRRSWKCSTRRRIRSRRHPAWHRRSQLAPPVRAGGTAAKSPESMRPTDLEDVHHGRASVEPNRCCQTHRPELRRCGQIGGFNGAQPVVDRR